MMLPTNCGVGWVYSSLQSSIWSVGESLERNEMNMASKGLYFLIMSNDPVYCAHHITYLLSPCYALWHIGQGQVSSTLLCCLLFFSTVPQVYPLSFNSFSIVRLHVVLGLPLFLFPTGVHLRATLVMSSDGLRRTWPSHLLLFCISKVSMSLVLVISCKSLLEILLGQNIFIIFLRHVLWKLESLLMSLSVILQHSEPYRSTDNTQLLYSLSLVFFEKAVIFQMLPNLMNADLVFHILIFISLSAPPSVVIQLPR